MEAAESEDFCAFRDFFRFRHSAARSGSCVSASDKIYRGTNTRREESPSSTDYDREPADPPDWAVDYDERLNTRIAPRNCVDDIPVPLRECGCGSCPDRLDPLATPAYPAYAGRECDSPRPVSFEKAGEIYTRYTRATWNQSEYTSRYEKHNQKYAQILQSDRLLNLGSTITTVVLTRRLSPVDDHGSWIPPLEVDEMLNGGDIRSRVRGRIRYQLKDKLGLSQLWYVAVTAPTESAGTPHEHIYYWIHDPYDEVSVEHFEPALQEHIDSCERAYREDHQYRQDGTEGAITVEHDPSVVDEPPEKLEAVIEQDATSQDQEDDYVRNTRGTQYLASQLPHLQLGDLYDGQESDPRETLLQGAAVAWASNYDWVRTSQNFHSL